MQNDQYYQELYQRLIELTGYTERKTVARLREESEILAALHERAYRDRQEQEGKAA